jgi:cytochrome b subunit of formate dehydrogenase
VWRALKVFFGRSREMPRYGRFNFVEKFDYWAVYWGVVIMVGTGTLMSFNTYFMNRLGPYSMHVAKVIHSDEALLASLALLIWHFYWAHFNPAKFPINMAMFSGRISIEEMIHEHPLELAERIRRGEVPRDALAKHPEWLRLHPEAGLGDEGAGEADPGDREGPAGDRREAPS